ncbi:MAG: hypothetical protein JXD22_13950 [Sedimentisphaerales bacterium]|nr:hypothetical protein [Sedimentisphaerales bacterium]
MRFVGLNQQQIDHNRVKASPSIALPAIASTGKSLTTDTAEGAGNTRPARSVSEKVTSVEHAIPARQVSVGKPILRWCTQETCVLSGFYTRLSNAIGPVEKPTIVGIRIDGQLLAEQVQIPVYGSPLNQFTATGGKMAVPLDVGQEYRVALENPRSLSIGQIVVVEVLDSESLRSGLTAGLQFQGIWKLTDMRAPFREVRGSGPISRAEWSPRQLIVTGNQIRGDSLCAPQNNSGIVSDPNGALYQFTAFYSVDEQYGGGRLDSYSRLYGFQRRPGQTTWEPLGLLVDPVPMGLTYAGDPFAFRDLQGRPCLIFTTVDGTRGFHDWKHIDARLMRSQSNSFAGPWSKERPIFEGLASVDSHRHRVNCLRIYPRVRHKDYLIVWLHGESDISWKGILVKDLDQPLSHQQVLTATQLSRNQEEGGAGFVRGDKGYLSTWQIPSINDPTGIQRLYEFDLDDPLNPERWQIVPGSVGWTDPRQPLEDGGPTADSWALSYLPEQDELWATMIVWSASQKRNSVLTCSTAWDRRQGSIFRLGVPACSWNSHGIWQEVAPVVEYAVGWQCSLVGSITGYGSEAYLCLGLGPSAQPLLHGAVCIEVTEAGARLAYVETNGSVEGLTKFVAVKFASGRPYRLELIRDGWIFRAAVDDINLGPVAIDSPVIRQCLTDNPRFKFLARRGGYYELTDVVLTDGPKTSDQ